MSTSFALRAHLRAVVIRGVSRFRSIELTRELEEQLLLESRMAVAAESPDGRSPSPLDILLRCKEIQAGWSEADRDRRILGVNLPLGDELTPDERLARRRKRNLAAVYRMAARREAAGLPKWKSKLKPLAVSA